MGTVTNMNSPLRIGFIGSGFIANFHLDALQAVRDAHLAAVFSPTPAHREALAHRANDLGIGPCQAVDSLESLLTSEVDAIWILSPNHVRLDHMSTIHRMVMAQETRVYAVACEKPLGRTLTEARQMLHLAETAGLKHGYLENQVFAPAVRRGRDILWRRGAANAGRPYLVRAAEEHSGPHQAWFWRGEQQGGGALLDMMCHSIEVGRHLLTEPGQDHGSIRILTATGTVASLKWTRPEYAAQLRTAYGPAVDYTRWPVEDVATGILTGEDVRGHPLLIQSNASWAYVGAGLRIQIEVLGPEYTMEINTLDSGLNMFLSREITGTLGEDLIEKQNAEQGIMPILEDEAATYGYVLEDRHMVQAFRQHQTPIETFHDGVAVTEMLMALYRSADIAATVKLPDTALNDYIPSPARRHHNS